MPVYLGTTPITYIGPPGPPGPGTPCGSIIPWPTDAIPDGWLLCDGSAVSRETYADLFFVIGTTYGTGDGSTTFNLPNLKGKIPVGKDLSQTEFDTIAETGGEKTHTLTQAELPNVTANTLLSLTTGSPGYYRVITPTANYGPTPVITEPLGSGTAHNNLQPYIVFNYIINTQKEGAYPGGGGGSTTLWQGTSEDYAALPTKDENTFYLVTDEGTSNGLVPGLGNTDDFLVKSSDTPYDIAWRSPTTGGLPYATLFKKDPGLTYHGGNILLQHPETQCTLAGQSINICHDMNLFRILEGATPYKGAYIDLTECAAGVGTKIWHSGNYFGQDGWGPFQGGTLTYVNSYTFTVNGDWTSVYAKGDKLKWTQNGTIRYNDIVGNPTYDGSKTTINLHQGYVATAGDCSVLNTTNYPMTNVYYSKLDNPTGYPRKYNYVLVWGSTGTAPNIGNGTASATFSLTRTICTYGWKLTYGSTTTFGTGNYTYNTPLVIVTAITSNFAPWDPGVMGYITSGSSTDGASTHSIWLSGFAVTGTWTKLDGYWTPTYPFTQSNGDVMSGSGTFYY